MVIHDEITLSINPLYTCNFRCSFCYLTKEQLSSKDFLDLSILDKRLSEVSSRRKIKHVDLYGGELSLLTDEYCQQLTENIRKYGNISINVVTNLSKITNLFLRKDVDLSVSWDGDLRQDHNTVFGNILAIDKEVHILMLASPHMLNWSDEKIESIIGMLNMASNIVSVEIKPYSTNQANQFQTSYKSFEEFIIKWIKRSDKFNFDFINEHLILDSLAQKKNAWSDDHLYITPTGKFAVLEFDKNYHEYFLELERFDDYLNWCNKEKLLIKQNSICSSCHYLGNCLSEHLRNHPVENDSCDGFKGLLDWYGQNINLGSISWR
jgi:sulfatase maturation enzyme AslB (radical SAM superfamily)